MRMIFLAAGTALALAACGGGDEASQTDLATNNLLVDDLGTANGVMEGDMNMTGDMNATVDANTQNASEQDLTTNNADTNLANGL